MNLSEAVQFIRSLHNQLYMGSIDSQVNRKSSLLWNECDNNVLLFMSRLDPESREKLLAWLARLGIADTNQIRDAYIVATLLLKRLLTAPPQVLQNWTEHQHRVKNIIPFLCDFQGSADKVVAWAQEAITEEELDAAFKSGSIHLSVNPPIPPAQRRPPIAAGRPRQSNQPGTRIAQPNRSNQPAPTRMAAVSQNDQSQVRGARSLDELKRIFGEN